MPYIRSPAGLFTARCGLLAGIAAFICVVIVYSQHSSLHSSKDVLRLDRQGRPCTGPQLTPAQRPEPWFSFANVLADEVTRADKYTVSKLWRLPADPAS